MQVYQPWVMAAVSYRALFRGCSLVTDVGVLARYGQLVSIDLEGCNLVTDAGVSALGHGCGQLQIIDLRGCSLVTDAGI